MGKSFEEEKGIYLESDGWTDAESTKNKTLLANEPFPGGFLAILLGSTQLPPSFLHLDY